MLLPPPEVAPAQDVTPAPRRAAPPLPPPTVVPPPGWYGDPWVPGGARWWDGRAWTGFAAVPPPPLQPRAPHPTLPLRAAVGVLLVLAVSLIGERALLEWLARYEWPVALYIVVAAVFGYLPVVLYTRHASRRFGTGRLRDDAGFRFRAVDAGFGPLTWLCAYAAQLAVGVAVFVLRIPMESNLEGADRLNDQRGVLLALGITAVIVAPFVEELAFRGIVLRGFLSVMPPWLAVGAQGVLFGCAHFDPARGLGNLGLIIILSSVGIVLGASAYLFRRIGPTIIAHGIINAVALVITIFVLPSIG